MANVIPFEPKSEKLQPGDPNAYVTPDGDILNVGTSEFANLDLESLFNMREWVRAALESNGAKCIGAGIGLGGPMGIADVQIEIDGHQFNIEIRPLGAVAPIDDATKSRV